LPSHKKSITLSTLSSFVVIEEEVFVGPFIFGVPPNHHWSMIDETVAMICCFICVVFYQFLSDP
jgi:hypothetical protein